MVEMDLIKMCIVENERVLQEKFSEENIIDREIRKSIERNIGTDVAVFITGVRRCGKSILTYLISKNKKAAYVNFEDERLSIKGGELNKVMEAIYSLKGKIGFFVFDEIQNIEGWEKFIARIIKNKKVIITGSNARLLSKELSSFLTGRHIDFVLFPFSFKEFLKYVNFEPNIYLTENISRLKDYLSEYLVKGGFPLSLRLGNLFLINNYKDIVERDVVERYKIKYPKTLKEIAKYLISNSSSEISFNKLKKMLNIKSVHTVKNYISYLENAYLIFLIERFSPKLKEQFLAPKKVYCIDNGIITALSFKLSQNKGKLMENLVAIELLRRKFYFHPDYEIYYWKDYQQREVDFVVKKEDRIKYLIQVCFSVDEINTREREIKSLMKADKELKSEKMLIITWDTEEKIKINGKIIELIPLWKWLLTYD